MLLQNVLGDIFGLKTKLFLNCHDLQVATIVTEDKVPNPQRHIACILERKASAAFGKLQACLVQQTAKSKILEALGQPLKQVLVEVLDSLQIQHLGAA
ncbi:hypothetical protein K1719_036810 [Acacia pycnantha]|nr:hypothetical protein K1719_036810 [Acacia pycnantha]